MSSRRAEAAPARGVWVAAVLALLAVAWGAALRYEALVARYGPLSGSSEGAERLQRGAAEAIARLRPAGYEQTPAAAHDAGDPVNYLKFAREMEGFYQAHVREPLFVFSTRAFLGWLDDRDVAVSYASAAYSTLLVAATALLGWSIGPPWVGAAAAAAMAVETKAIALGVGGWRDDAFAAFFVLAAAALLRMRNRPTWASAALAGIAAAAACLTRITALSFVLPGLALLLFVPRDTPPRRRAAYVAVSFGLVAALVAPYLVRCAVVYGDPFYAINYHTGFYRQRVGLETDEKLDTAEFIAAQAEEGGALETLGTAIAGVTTYPFANKWSGFRPWGAWIGRALSSAAIVGLVLLLLSPPGRLLLLLLVASLLPYAFTWTIRGGSEWRFTLHAYPVYLVAAGFAASRIGSLVASSARRRLVEEVRSRRQAVVAGALVVLLLALAGAGLVRFWPRLLVREDLVEGRDLTITAEEGAVFFADGWYDPARQGNVVGRYARGERATLSVPLVGGREYRFRFRLQPYSREAAPERIVRVDVNGRTVGRFRLRWDPDEIGAYETVVPAEAVRDGTNEIVLEAEGADAVPPGERRFPGLSPGQQTAFMLWYLRVSDEAGGRGPKA